MTIGGWKYILVSTELGNAKKDLIYMSISGLDEVDFGNKDLSTCVTTGVIGAGTVQDTDQTYCISEQKIIDWIHLFIETSRCKLYLYRYWYPDIS